MSQPRGSPEAQGPLPASAPRATPTEERQRVLLDYVSRSWPVVGRDQTLQQIRDLFDVNSPAGVVLTGAAGVGKTRLARAVVGELSANGFASEWIIGSDASQDIPLAAFAHLLPPPDGAIHTSLLELLRTATAEIARRAASQPLVLYVDDADRLDPASATLLRELTSRSVVSVLLTIRTGSPVPDAVRALWKDGHVDRIEVLALGLDDVSHLVTTALGGEVEQATLHRLWQTTTGNPLFVREVVVTGIENGALTESDGVWRWQGSMGSGTRLREMVEERLARLDPQHRRQLEVLAFGEPLGVAEFEALAGIDVVDALERLELLGVVRNGQRQHVRLAHPIYGEVLRAGTPTFRARAIQRELAAAAEHGPRRRREDFLTIARWQLAAGTAKDPVLLLQAATHAAGTFEFGLAERFARAALETGAGVAASDLVAQGLRGQGRCQEAEDVWATMEAATTDDGTRSAITTARALNMFFGLGAAERAETLLLEAEGQAESEESRELLRANRALLALYSGKAADALETARPLVERDDVEDRNRIDAATAASTAMALAGRTAEALEMTDRTLPLALAQPATGMIDAGVLVAVRFLSLSAAGRLVEAHDEIRAAYDFTVSAQQHEGMAVLGSAVGQASLALGDVSGAVSRLREASALLRERDRNRYLPWCLGALSQALVFSGDVDGARLALAEADATRKPGVRLFETEIERARAWLSVARGDRSTAVDTLRATATWAMSVGQRAPAAAALHDVVRLGRAKTVHAQLVELSSASDSLLLRLYAEHGEAAMSHDPERLQASGSAFEEIGALVLAAETHARAAVRWRQDGRAGRAASAAVHAQELLGRCTEARPPAMPSVDASLPLTPREQEIAMMAARGLTSRQIAATLFVSVRTVDNHLHRSYEKLGVRNRAELAALLCPE